MTADATSDTPIYVAGIYPESPSHILDKGAGTPLCGSRISVYARRLDNPLPRLCAKCAKKALFRTDDVSQNL